MRDLHQINIISIRRKNHKAKSSSSKIISTRATEGEVSRVEEITALKNDQLAHRLRRECSDLGRGGGGGGGGGGGEGEMVVHPLLSEGGGGGCDGEAEMEPMLALPTRLRMFSNRSVISGVSRVIGAHIKTAT